MSRAAAHRLALAPSKDIQGGIVKRTIKEMISDKLASVIASGALRVGDELPSERELALGPSRRGSQVRRSSIAMTSTPCIGRASWWSAR